MKRPAIQFYPGDWRNNANLRRCSWEARGVWIEVIGLLHDSDTYGVLRWPLTEIAQALGAPIKALKELTAKGVLKGSDKGDCEPYIYTARHAGKDGDPVTLIATQPGPIWYSTRMVRDEWVRNARGKGTRFGDDNGPPTRAPNGPPKGGIGETPKADPSQRIGDGPSSSSSTSLKTNPLMGREEGKARPESSLPPTPHEPFAMSPDWQPSPHFASLAKIAGFVETDPESIAAATGEFVAYWLTQPTRKRTQHEWDHALVKSLKSEKTRSTQPTQGAPNAGRSGHPRPITATERNIATIAGLTGRDREPERPAIDGTAERVG